MASRRRKVTGRRVFRAAVRVGRARRLATGAQEEWSSLASLRAGGDRTRLTGRLVFSSIVQNGQGTRVPFRVKELMNHDLDRILFDN